MLQNDVLMYTYTFALCIVTLNRIHIMYSMYIQYICTIEAECVKISRNVHCRSTGMLTTYICTYVRMYVCGWAEKGRSQKSVKDQDAHSNGEN